MAEDKKPEGEQRQKPRKRDSRSAPAEKKSTAVRFSMAFPARVEEVSGRTGTRGDAIQVRCKVLDGRDKNKVLRRNVKGPVQKGDILMLRETEIEARHLSKAGRGMGG
tara:strand:+ start:126 stop:449 length:324 start_codon:yes stop_codon:yes gene_type:complete